MAAVDLRQAGEPVSDGHHRQVSNGFTAVNNISSFRPSDSSTLNDQHRHFTEHNGPLDQLVERKSTAGPSTIKEHGTDSGTYSPARPATSNRTGKVKRKSSFEMESSPKHVRSHSQAAPPHRLGDRTDQHFHDAPEAAAGRDSQDTWYRRLPTGEGALETRLADPLQTDLHSRDARSPEDESNSPPERHAPAPLSNDGGSHVRPDESLLEDKKLGPGRKRVFSQRTKTGCHTCRERKKKCDEAKPVCSNCIRGNFTCKGYGPKNDLDIRPHKHPPLQSKPTHVSPPVPPPALLPAPSSTPAPTPAPAPANALAPPVVPPAPPAYFSPSARHPTEGWLGAQTTAMPMFDRTRQAIFEQPEPLHAAWPRQAYVPSAPENDHESSYPHEHYTPSAYSRSDRPTISSQYSGNFGPNIGANTAEGSRAFGHHHALSHSGNIASRMSEKEKMLTGKNYQHYLDPKLIEERHNCRVSLERFNKACQPSMGASNEERSRLFRAIVRPDYILKNPQPGDPIGYCGSRVLVEAPFTCHYGYNINIGDDVVISEGCLMLDPCRITIGNRTVIGPNVKFYGMMMPLDPKVRAGNQGMSYGGSIVVEDDCFIGGDVKIMPNRTIRKGAVVGAGTIVTHDVQANTVVAGTPMRVMRGIGRDADDKHKSHIQAENDASIAIMMAEMYGGSNASLPIGR